MPTIGSATRTIRFNPSDLGKIEGVMKEEDTSFNNAVHLLIERASTPQKIEKSDVGTPKKEEKRENVGTPKAYQSVCEMANLMRVDPESLVEQFNDMLEEGTLYFENGRLINPRYDYLERICEEKKANIDNIISKVIREVENGK